MPLRLGGVQPETSAPRLKLALQTQAVAKRRQRSVSFARIVQVTLALESCTKVSFL